MITTWLLTFWIDTGVFGYHRKEAVEFQSKVECMEQVKQIESQVATSGDKLRYAYCYPSKD
ncbi:hypothetical protein VP381E491_P0015 [Vibrio phage 381E49-1]|nr:hypothetical protein VP381E491_P0015 [Vibrio phage 381E49-1]